MRVYAQYLAAVEIPIEINDKFNNASEDDLVQAVFDKVWHTKIEVPVVITNLDLDSLVCITNGEGTVLAEI